MVYVKRKQNKDIYKAKKNRNVYNKKSRRRDLLSLYQEEVYALKEGMRAREMVYALWRMCCWKFILDRNERK